MFLFVTPSVCLRVYLLVMMPSFPDIDDQSQRKREISAPGEGLPRARASAEVRRPEQGPHQSRRRARGGAQEVPGQQVAADLSPQLGATSFMLLERVSTKVCPNMPIRMFSKHVFPLLSCGFCEALLADRRPHCVDTHGLPSNKSKSFQAHSKAFRYLSSALQDLPRVPKGAPGLPETFHGLPRVFQDIPRASRTRQAFSEGSQGLPKPSKRLSKAFQDRPRLPTTSRNVAKHHQALAHSGAHRDTSRDIQTPSMFIPPLFCFPVIFQFDDCVVV